MLRLRLCALSLVVCLLGAGLILGQGDKKDDKDKKADDKPAKFRGTLPANYKKLGLRDDQVQSIYKIQTTYRTKIAELRRQIDELRAKEREATEKVLTADQVKRLRELQTGKKDKDKDG
jgi:hypothetical protein